MHALVAVALLATSAQTPEKADPKVKANPWEISRTLKLDERSRTYHVRLPKTYDAKRATPVVLVLHGAGTNGKIMEFFCGMSNQADKSGFVAVYPNGTGAAETFLTWNAGQFPPATKGAKRPDDIGFLTALLDDLETVVHVDRKRVFVAGLSNGGMMAYRAAAEMSDRFAAMASVAGTLTLGDWRPKQPMPVLHIHGDQDRLVPFEGTKIKNAYMLFPPIDDVMKICAKANGCKSEPTVTVLEKTQDQYRVEKRDYGKGKSGAEVVLYMVEKGGHVWPGRAAPTMLGPSTKNLDSNAVIWEFFSRYQRDARAR